MVPLRPLRWHHQWRPVYPRPLLSHLIYGNLQTKLALRGYSFHGQGIRPTNDAASTVPRLQQALLRAIPGV